MSNIEHDPAWAPDNPDAMTPAEQAAYWCAIADALVKKLAAERAQHKGAVARVAELEAQVADLQAEKRAYRATGDELAAELDRLTREGSRR